MVLWQDCQSLKPWYTSPDTLFAYPHSRCAKLFDIPSISNCRVFFPIGPSNSRAGSVRFQIKWSGLSCLDRSDFAQTDWCRRPCLSDGDSGWTVNSISMWAACKTLGGSVGLFCFAFTEFMLANIEWPHARKLFKDFEKALGSHQARASSKFSIYIYIHRYDVLSPGLKETLCMQVSDWGN